MNQDVRLFVAAVQIPGDGDGPCHRAQIKVGGSVVWQSHPLKVTEPEAREAAMAHIRNVLTEFFYATVDEGDG